VGSVRKRGIENVSEQQNRETLERYFETFERQDPAAFVEFLHDDYVEEFPQSGERIRGKDNWRMMAENYPGLPTLADHSYKISGDLAVIEITVEYGGNRMHDCEVVELEDGKVKRRRAYFGEPFEAPEWRAQWVEGM
jgi:SnoaL-like domain